MSTSSHQQPVPKAFQKRRMAGSTAGPRKGQGPRGARGHPCNRPRGLTRVRHTPRCPHPQSRAGHSYFQPPPAWPSRSAGRGRSPKGPRWRGQCSAPLPARQAHPLPEQGHGVRRRGRYLHAGNDAQEAEDYKHVHQPGHVPQRQQAQHLRLPAETRADGLGEAGRPARSRRKTRGPATETQRLRESPRSAGNAPRSQPQLDQLHRDKRAEPEPPTPAAPGGHGNTFQGTAPRSAAGLPNPRPTRENTEVPDAQLGSQQSRERRGPDPSPIL